MKHFRKSDFFIAALIVAVFAAIIITNARQTMTVLSGQIENTATLRLSGIQTELQDVLSRAEDALTDFSFGMERLNRSGASENEIRTYIDQNPAKWAEDPYYETKTT